MFDFPASPTTGQTASGPGGAVWSWDGVKWTALGLASTTTPIGPAGGDLSGSYPNPWLRNTVSVMQYGAAGNGTTDDTAAFNNAIATGRTVYIPKGNYLIRGQITITTFGQIIYGDGKGVSVITVNTTFTPMTATAVFYVNLPLPYVPGPQFRDFSINFVQPDTTVRANLTNYPPAFYAQNMARCVWRGIKINAAMVCIDMRGNAGGCSVIDCELAGFNYSIMIDGSQDSITIENTRIEPDAMTNNQVQIFLSSGTVGISSGRCDDLHINGCLLFVYSGLYIFQGSSGYTFGEVSNCDFDTYYGFSANSGMMTFSSCSFTLGSAACISIQSQGGNFCFSSCWFYCAVNPTNAQILLSPLTGAETICNFSACQFWPQTDGMTLQAFGNNATTLVSMVGCTFSLPAITKTTSTVQINSGALLSMNGCRWNPRGTGSGQSINVGWDAAHNITGNSFGGWVTAIAGGTNTIFANNNL